MYACDTPWKTVDFAATYMAKLQGDGLDPNALPYAMSLVSSFRSVTSVLHLYLCLARHLELGGLEGRGGPAATQHCPAVLAATTCRCIGLCVWRMALLCELRQHNGDQ
jgi:hypothetical protein